jgi:alanine dehydrogenase
MAAEVDTLVLTRADIVRLVEPQAYLEAVHEAFRRLGAGEIETPAVGKVPALDGAFHIKSAIGTRAPQRAVVKVNGNFPNNVARFGLPVIQGFIALLDGESGRVLALMDSMEITARRTAASSAVAARLLARSASERLALIGCGVQARHHLEILAALFPLRSVALFDRSISSARSLAEVASNRGLTVDIASSSAAGARGADIVVTTTPSRAALLDTEDVSVGCFVAAVGADSAGKQELSSGLLKRARVVPDVLAQAQFMGDLQHAFASAVMSPQDIHGELADVVIGRVPARKRDEEIFVFDSTGSAIADLAAAEAGYEAALREGAGLRLRLDS